MALILVIDDDPTQRLVAGGALRGGGHDVIEAADGLRGLTMAGDYGPDLIVCDVQMPKMDGYEVVATLRGHPSTAEIPIVLVTALSERSQVRTGMMSGADDYITKPYHAKELCDAVDRLLKRQAQANARTMGRIGEELATQQKALAKRYEQQLSQELNERWITEQDGNGEVTYAQASLLLADVFGGPLSSLVPGEDLASAARKAYLAACDTLYLFGARHALPYGSEVLGVFVEREEAEDSAERTSQRQALRAAHALQRAANAILEAGNHNPRDDGLPIPELTIALHQGPITVLRVSDAMQGGDPVTLAVGESVRALGALRVLAQRSQWRLAATSAAMAGIGDALTCGRSAALAREGVPLQATELLPHR